MRVAARWLVIVLLASVACQATPDENSASPSRDPKTDHGASSGGASASSDPVATQSEPPLATRQFQTPSRNIHCTLLRGSLLCEIGSRLQPEPSGRCASPSGWVGLILPAIGGTTPECSAHLGVGFPAPTLDYGHRWQKSGISCDSESSGLTCTNAIGNGFFLSRAEWHAISFTSGSVEHGQFFQTPSHNIVCATLDRTLRCDILSGLNPEPTEDCPVDWVGLFVAAESRNTGPQCAGDTVASPGEPVLEYDTEWRRAGFTCDSSESALYCWNDWGHGFLLSRERWKTY